MPSSEQRRYSGQWLCGRFWYQRSAVRIRLFAFYLPIVNFIGTPKIKKKEAKMAQLDKPLNQSRVLRMQWIPWLYFRTVLPEMEKASGDVGLLFKVFESRRDTLKTKYGRFCLNKPKSEYIIQEHIDYFTVSFFPSNVLIFKNGPSLVSFFVYFRSFHANNTNFYNKSMWKNVQMSIQYTELGFESTTLRTWVVTHNH